MKNITPKLVSGVFYFLVKVFMRKESHQRSSISSGTKNEAKTVGNLTQQGLAFIHLRFDISE
jgi:hypothetical protein